MVQHPALRTIVRARRVGACDAQIAYQAPQGLLRFPEIARIGEPVVHLQVDVGGPLAAPGGPQLLVPDALQVRRLAAGSRRGDEQVAAEVEVPVQKFRVVGLGEGLDPSIGRLGRGRVTELQLHSREQRGEVVHVTAAQLVEGALGGAIDVSARGSHRVPVDVAIVPEAGRVAEKNGDSAGVRHLESPVCRAHRSTVMHDTSDCRKAQPGLVPGACPRARRVVPRLYLPRQEQSVALPSSATCVLLLR